MGFSNVLEASEAKRVELAKSKASIVLFMISS